MNSSKKTLALLIDGDNIALKHTQVLIQFCESYGTLGIKKAYGDWKQPNLVSHRQTMSELGIHCEQQDRVGKNATDFALTMDVALMLEKGGIDTYFIVSSDGDFTAMCQRIRQKGAKVIGIGSKSHTSSDLRKSCNQYFDVEEIVKNQSKSPAKTPSTPTLKSTPTTKAAPPSKASPAPKPMLPSKASPAPKPMPPPKASPVPKPMPTVQASPAPKATPLPKASPAPTSAPILEILIQAHQKVEQKDGWVHLGQFGSVLREADKQFEKRFAGKKLSTWLKQFPQNFEVVGDRVRIKTGKGQA